VPSVARRQHRARRGAGVSGVFDDEDAADEHRRASAARVLVRLDIGCAVLAVRGIEDRDVVGPLTLREQAAITEAQRSRRGSRHLVDGLLER
jgi:hypothetical protein